MRVNLGILLISILAASVARYIRISDTDRNAPMTRQDTPDGIRGAILGPPGRSE
jgi:hypothetical protein